MLSVQCTVGIIFKLQNNILEGLSMISTSNTDIPQNYVYIHVYTLTVPAVVSCDVRVGDPLYTRKKCPTLLQGCCLNNA